MIYQLCDDDDDGCMVPREILNMLQHLERVFARECSNIDLNSSILQQSISDRRAEHKFHFIMALLREDQKKKKTVDLNENTLITYDGILRCDLISAQSFRSRSPPFPTSIKKCCLERSPSKTSS